MLPLSGHSPHWLSTLLPEWHGHPIRYNWILVPLSIPLLLVHSKSHKHVSSPETLVWLRHIVLCTPQCCCLRFVCENESVWLGKCVWISLCPMALPPFSLSHSPSLSLPLSLCNVVYWLHPAFQCTTHFLLLSYECVCVRVHALWKGWYVRAAFVLPSEEVIHERWQLRTQSMLHQLILKYFLKVGWT